MSKHKFLCVAHYFMPKIYGCVTDNNTTRVWDLHVSNIKWGSLTLTPLNNVHTLLISEITNLAAVLFRPWHNYNA